MKDLELAKKSGKAFRAGMLYSLGRRADELGYVN